MRTLIVIFLFLQLNLAFSGIEYRKFESAELEARYNVLIDELRCLVCQNQNLKGSNSDLAKDMRDKIYQLIIEGKTDRQIKSYMVDRYGDFVLYKPPFKSITLFLWLGPLLFFIIALIVIIRVVKQRSRVDSVETLTEEEHQRAQQLLQAAQQEKDNKA